MNNKQPLTYDEYLETLTDYAADLLYDHASSPEDGTVDPCLYPQSTPMDARLTM